MQLELDASRGYAAIPDAIHHIKMSDGAYRLLIILCAHASHATGLCDPSHAYLAHLMGKSKASITNHMKELRGLGLIETTSKPGRGGGNGKLDILVTFWAAWRKAVRVAGEARQKAKVGSARIQQSKRVGVQQNERVCKNQTNYNHIPPAPMTHHIKATPAAQASPQAECVIKKLVEEWMAAKGKEQFPRFERAPSPDLVAATEDLLRRYEAPSTDTAMIPAGIKAEISSLWTSLGVAVDAEMLAVQEKAIQSTPAPANYLRQFITVVRSTWKDYWRQPPTARHLSQMLNDAGRAIQATPDTLVRLLRSDMSRYRKCAVKGLLPA